MNEEIINIINSCYPDVAIGKIMELINKKEDSK